MYYMFPAFNVFYILKKKPINYLSYTNIFTLYVFLSLIFFFYNIVYLFSFFQIFLVSPLLTPHMQLTSHICNQPHKHPVNLAHTKSTSHTYNQPHVYTINLMYTQSTSYTQNRPHTYAIHLILNVWGRLYVCEVDFVCVRSILCTQPHTNIIDLTCAQSTSHKLVRLLT